MPTSWREAGPSPTCGRASDPGAHRPPGHLQPSQQGLEPGEGLCPGGGGAVGLRCPGRGPAKLCEHGPHGCHSGGEAKPRLRHTPPATHVCRGHPADCAGDHSRWALSAHSSALRARPQSARDGPACACWVPPAGRTCVSPDTCSPHPTPDPTCSPCLHPVSPHLTALLPFLTRLVCGLGTHHRLWPAGPGLCPSSSPSRQQGAWAGTGRPKTATWMRTGPRT